MLIDQALSSRDISPSALTRGAAYLFRMGAYKQAQRLAAAASTKDPGFLPAQLAALRCAMQSNDHSLLEETSALIESSVHRLPLNGQLLVLRARVQVVV